MVRDYFVRPYVLLGGGVIDGYEANAATARSEGFANVVTSSVDLDEGIARTYVNVTGPSAGGSATRSAAGVLGDTVRFYGLTGDPVNVSYAFDGTIFATPLTAPDLFFQIGIYATLYVFDVSAGATYNNFTSQPGALVSQARSLDFSDPATVLNASVNETLFGSFTPVAGPIVRDIFRFGGFLGRKRQRFDRDSRFSKHGAGRDRCSRRCDLCYRVGRLS